MMLTTAERVIISVQVIRYLMQLLIHVVLGNANMNAPIHTPILQIKLMHQEFNALTL